MVTIVVVVVINVVEIVEIVVGGAVVWPEGGRRPCVSGAAQKIRRRSAGRHR